ncbi:MAG: glycosyltransferase family 2 protein [Planctomycetota bacterium]
MGCRALTALPVFNEAKHVSRVLDLVVRQGTDVLVVDDGSTDGTHAILAARRDIAIASHGKNQGYGAALRTAFAYSLRHGYDVLVTIDCDGQHEPQLIPAFVAACLDQEMVSGTRYLHAFAGDSAPPPERLRINQLVTAEVNRRLGLSLTDAFCGFKAYRVPALAGLRITNTGYAMPLELWVQAVALKWRIRELAVPLIYLDEARSFGGALDNADTRLRHYLQVLDQAESEVRSSGWLEPLASPAPQPGCEACSGGQQSSVERPSVERPGVERPNVQQSDARQPIADGSGS